MTKDEARKYLEDYLKEKNGKLPIYDEIVKRFSTPLIIEDITFILLICIAYDLTPKINQNK